MLRYACALSTQSCEPPPVCAHSKVRSSDRSSWQHIEYADRRAKYGVYFVLALAIPATLFLFYSIRVTCLWRSHLRARMVKIRKREEKKRAHEAEKLQQLKEGMPPITTPQETGTRGGSQTVPAKSSSVDRLGKTRTGARKGARALAHTYLAYHVSGEAANLVTSVDDLYKNKWFSLAMEVFWKLSGYSIQWASFSQPTATHITLPILHGSLMATAAIFNPIIFGAGWTVRACR